MFCKPHDNYCDEVAKTEKNRNKVNHPMEYATTKMFLPLGTGLLNLHDIDFEASWIQLTESAAGGDIDKS